MAEFRVVIEGLELDEASTKHINDRIQKVVLDYFTELDLTKPGDEKAVVAFRPNREWYGIWLHVLNQDEVRNIPQIRKSFEPHT